MHILLLGSGGREHALAWAIRKSPLVDHLFVAPGNPGMNALGQWADLGALGSQDVIAFCRKKEIDLVVIGPEIPLVAGLVDALEDAGIMAFGPRKAAAALEGSKGFMKDLCAEENIPTANYRRFSKLDEALSYVREVGAPIVVKADGLAAGKGVVVAQTVAEAQTALEEMFAGRFGAAGQSVVIEECMQGEEVSFFVLVDGTTVMSFATAQDHKRVGEGETGPNTGGMGAYSPAPIVTPEIEHTVMTRIIQPTVNGLAKRGTPFRGFLYAGLMLTREGPKLIEYNVRLGDPEAQVILPRLESDLVGAILACCQGRLNKTTLKFSEQTALTVVLAAKGYPGTPKSGGEIRNLTVAEGLKNVLVFHAGTSVKDGKLIATGGRVLNITGLGKDVEEARLRAYRAAEMVDWKDGFCRRDIGWRALRINQVRD